MLTAESGGSVLANSTPLARGETRSNSGGDETGSPPHAMMRRTPKTVGRKRTQYSLKRLAVLGAALLLTSAQLGVIGCRDKPIDQGALLTARTVGLAELERGRLAEAEQEFTKVIELAPKEPGGYANLGLTYLRAGRLDDAESRLERARRLDPRS